MKPHLVADVGNSRIKWGLCAEDRIIATASLPPADRAAWQHQLADWNGSSPLSWVVTGVHPDRRDALSQWLQGLGHAVQVIASWKELGLTVQIEQPECVGIDRLLNAVAAKSRAQRAVSLILVDAGSAVTVDWVDETGAFRGGSIFPGLRLMTRALHCYTYLLPLVEVRDSNPPLPGTSTQGAIEAGVFWAVAGGIKALIRQLAGRAQATRKCQVFLTGGDASWLAPVLEKDIDFWPHMTLEGIRLAAEALP